MVALGCAVLTVGLGLAHAGDRRPGPLDRAVAAAIDAALADDPVLLRVFVLPTEPAVLLVAVAAIAFWCAWRRRWGGAALVVAAPAVAVTLNTWVLKPLFGRYYDDHLAYPSGHTVSLVAVLAVLALLARPGPPIRWAGIAGVAVLALVAAGMVGLHYHYVTDVVGGAAFAVGVTAALEPAVAVTTGWSRRRPWSKP